ncbi:MAG: alpha/beta fold hydrolase [Oscillospiraceae bacterium]|nr:alpha/beta fold hydrolase [Oscillospiraceae bacterium]
MTIEEFGKENTETIVMLHGANFVHTFGSQYVLAEKYHIAVPHLMGYGNNTAKAFQTDECIKELADYIKSLNKKVWLVGFSLGAQLAFKLVSEYEELFKAAIIVSPWLIKEEAFLSKIAELNLKQNKQFKNKFFCNFVGLMNGLPSKQRKEFVAQMQNVSEETAHNVVYNGITLDSTPSFKDVEIPIIALAGAKEQKEVHDSVKKMSEINKNCRFEIWDRAGHNIPPLFAKRFNELIRQNFEA